MILKMLLCVDWKAMVRTWFYTWSTMALSWSAAQKQQIVLDSILVFGYYTYMDKDIIWKAQMAALREMEVNLVSLIKVANETQSRIRDQGLGGNYSQNHDCFNYASNVWKQSLRLAELKKLEYELTGKDQNGRVIKKKDS